MRWTWSRYMVFRWTGTIGRSTSGRRSWKRSAPVAPGKKVWVTEVGASSFGAEEVQAFGLQRTAELLAGRAERVYWYSLFDLPASWTATTRHKEAEGSSYYRHYYMGLLKEDGSPKLAAERWPGGELGICQWFHYRDHRLQQGVEWLRKTRRAASADGRELGGFVSRKCDGLVRRADECTGGIFGHDDLMLHAGAFGPMAPLHGASQGQSGIRGLRKVGGGTVRAGEQDERTFDHVQLRRAALAKKSILVTGGAGFVGSHLPDALLASGA